MLKFKDLSIEDVKAGKLADQLPEFYQLKNIIENNAGHINDPVFDHCVRTAEKMLELILKAPSNVRKILQEKVGKESREDVLFLAALLHDVGKLTVPMNSEGAFIGHEQAGAELVRDIFLKRIDISSVAQEHLVFIIENHGLLHALSNNQEDLEGRVLEAIQEFPSIFPELILLVLADLIASDLFKLNPVVYNFKVSFFEKMLVDWPE